jgi:hypothetical protein
MSNKSPLLLTIAVLLFGGVGPALYGQTLTRAVLNTVTDGDDKDHDTCVWAIVTTSDGASQLASIKNGDCGGDNTTHYDDHSTHEIAFQIDAPGAKREACKGFKVHLWQKTHGGAGHDTWKVDDATVTLYFDDGLNLTARTGSFTLSSHSEDDAPSVDFANGSN